MKYFFIFSFLLFAFVHVWGQSEEQLDELFLNKKVAEQSQNNVMLPQWDFFGFLENENAFGISGHKSMTAKNIAKIEMRSRLHVRYGVPHFYAQSIFEIAFYPQSFSNQFANHQGSDPFFANITELYIGGGKSFQFKIGKIAYNWGNADFYSLTNYFDQKDLRELVFKEADERYLGGAVSLQLKYLFKTYAVETVISTQNPYPLLPAKNSFWELKVHGYPHAQMDFSQTDSSLRQQSFKDLTAAVRMGGSNSGVDFYFSYFNGFSDAIFFLEEHRKSKPLQLKTVRQRLNKLGFDLAWTYKKFSGRLELLFSPDYLVRYKNNATATDRVPYLAFTIGGDFLFRGDYGRIIIEGSTGFFLQNFKDYKKSLLGDFFLIAIQDRVFKDRIGIFVGVIGVFPKIQLDYDFKNGLTIAVGTLLFFHMPHEIVYMYRHHDIFYLRARYDF